MKKLLWLGNKFYSNKYYQQIFMFNTKNKNILREYYYFMIY